MMREGFPPASKDKPMSYDRMPEREPALAAKVAAILAEAGAEATDPAEMPSSAMPGATSCRPGCAPTRARCLPEIREAKAALEAERRPAPASPMPSRIRGPGATPPIPRAA
jgi:hypothetical protein